jgi:hypothetical protein
MIAAAGPLIQNVEVKENPKKPPKQPRLVTPLTIELAGQNEPETYEDLDEIIFRWGWHAQGGGAKLHARVHN